MGRELDSLADIISFGVAPVALGFAAGLDGALDVAALLYFVCRGISRLARYNITVEAMAAETGKVTYFEGTPIPTSVLPVALLVALTRAGRIGADLPLGVLTLAGCDLHPIALVYVVSGSLMISKTLSIAKPWDRGGPNRRDDLHSRAGVLSLGRIAHAPDGV
jgi:CDP-diacylglycerol--serine O-phosphatidyltransferase